MPSLRAVAGRHDYARIWAKLKPEVRDRRITRALRRLAEGETLREVSTAWSVTPATLCRALIAWAPTQWRAALVSQTLAQAEAIANGERNITRARERLKLLEWRMKRTLISGPLQFRGWELVGPCAACGHESGVYVRKNGPARCYQCDWTGGRNRYLRSQIRK